MNAAAPTTGSFQDVMAENFLSVSLTTRAPRRTTTVPQVAQIIHAQNQANVKGTVSIMPEDLEKKVRAANRLATSEMSKIGWPLSSKGTKTEYLVPVSCIEQAYLITATAKETIDTVVTEATQDWATFVQRAFTEAGTLSIPQQAFPYNTALEYAAQFDIAIRTQPLVSGSLTATLPAGLSTMVVDKITHENTAFFDSVLDSIRNTLAVECLDLATKVGGSQRISARTFNKIMHTIKLAESTSMSACQVILRVCTRITSDYETLETNPGCLGPDDSDNAAFDGTYATKYKAMLGTMAQALRGAMTIPVEK